MRKLTAILILFVVSFVSQAQNLGYVDSQMILEKVPEVKEANANLETFGAQLQKKGQEMLQEFQTKYTDLEKRQQRGEISPKQLEEEMALLKAEEEKIMNFDQESQLKLMQKREKLLTPILDKIQASIDKVADASGFDYIIDKSTGFLLYADPTNDISAKVMKDLGIQ